MESDYLAYPINDEEIHVIALSKQMFGLQLASGRTNPPTSNTVGLSSIIYLLL